MQILKKLVYLHLLILLTLNFSLSSIAHHQTPNFCGKIRLQEPFFHQNATNKPSPVNQMVLCKSQKLYFRTSLGLFPISSIDYANKLLTISHHSSSSSSSNFLSPSLLYAGFPSPPPPNSLALFGCSSNNHAHKIVHNCSILNSCKAYKVLRDQNFEKASSCLLVNDLEKLDMGFHPKDLNCSRYTQVYRNKKSSVVDNLEGYDLGTRISFNVPDHVPNICDECEKPHGNCGIGLRCICHPKERKDKVISNSVTIDSTGNIIFSLLFSFIFVVVFVKG
ncbi:uncharacterized protein LOC130755169 isoform X1 [Actinidia eriantha]|uniref:uncharacterized protein LOC130755169 isoform X1 n=1 Tax=Actinidia eriantha TaxID=165200 RepID=UPI00258F7AB5|nr:uncharacterized protein LOC130755169 isoform X1 [Actinidia eriantha]